MPAPPSSLLTRRNAVVCRGVPQATKASIVSAKGAWLTDTDGRRFLDFASGIGVTNVGHCPPSVVAAIKAQADRLIHAGIHVVTYEGYVALCERLVALLPHGEVTKAMLVNTGAEAVENAVKIARQATGRAAIVCFTGGFHGRTLLGMTLTSKVSYKKGCGPFAPEVYRLPFPDRRRAPESVDEDDFSNRAMAAFKESLLTAVAANDIAAIVIEPMLGEGGFLPAPRGFLRGLREFATEHGIVLIFDEVQSGFGRTGHWGAFQHFGVTPDLSTWAKALGGGLPIAAVIGRGEVMDAVAPGTVGSTFGGNPIACAAALATIDAMEDLDLLSRARTIGDRVRHRFQTLQEKTTLVADVRGVGAMVGIELCIDGDIDRPATELTKAVLDDAYAAGLIALSAGIHSNVIRVLAPLSISDDDLEQGLAILEEAILMRTRRTR